MPANPVVDAVELAVVADGTTLVRGSRPCRPVDLFGHRHGGLETSGTTCTPAQRRRPPVLETIRRALRHAPWRDRSTRGAFRRSCSADRETRQAAPWCVPPGQCPRLRLAADSSGYYDAATCAAERPGHRDSRACDRCSDAEAGAIGCKPTLPSEPITPAAIPPCVRLPLSTLLSQALVAFTIEADHLFERRMPHYTTESLKRGEPVEGPWLISMPFWANGLKHVEPDGMTVGMLCDRELIADRFLQGNNPGLVRWGYLRLVPTTSSKKLHRDWSVVPTEHGRLAQQTWSPLPDEVDARWVERWPEVAKLRRSLERVVSAADRELPDHLPVNGGHQGRVSFPQRPPRPTADLDVGTLLAKALLLFTIDVERTSPVALVHAANVLRVLADGPLHQRELPRAMGVAKETGAVMTGLARRQGLVTIFPSKEVAITDTGRHATARANAAVAEVEADWPTELRAHLEPLVGDGVAARSPLADAIRPPTGTWRHRRPQPHTLPHHPVVSHRGGYPDGS